MEISHDPAKEARNIAERGLSFEWVARFDFRTALFWIDKRRDYGEVRYSGLGRVDGRVHALVFIETPVGIRVISFRKANKREVQHYEQASGS
ncbi:hypothetical protein ABB34_03565 [Stenotrophomonas daejeonensis]|uniref:BrnT family toxin n=1 Tax=Stenotrophomonas daejeonensis TaxID=659018 RepID=A0A0R0E157_9GAMM|nr:BrnT family toxin [Stenotrophomonas daejeonensis]KRG87680.1 hypothetical protein ABB34_03565 [Stenotrophomonas daejeonensis]